MIENTDQRSKDYSEIAQAYRPGHADYAYDAKYGFRDYRGGGRSSARETAARVAAGAVARLVIPEVSIAAYVAEIGGDTIDSANFDADAIARNPFWCPDAAAATRWESLVDGARKAGSSLGAVVECVATGVPRGLGRADLCQARCRSGERDDGHKRGQGRRVWRRLRRRPAERRAERRPDAAGFGWPALRSESCRRHRRGDQHPASRSFAVSPSSPPARSSPRLKASPAQARPPRSAPRGAHDPCVGIRGAPVVAAMMAAGAGGPQATASGAVRLMIVR